MIKKLIEKFKKKLKYKKAKAIYNQLYIDINGAKLSQLDRVTVIKDDFSLVYGEVTFDGFTKLLEIVQPNAGEVFYDLGSGTGKAVIIAMMTQKFSQAIGIELLPSLYLCSLSILQNFRKLINQPRIPIEFIKGDFLQFDISNANVVFINGTGFFGEDLKQLIDKLKILKKGSRVIITSKQLKSSTFKLIHQDLHCMSWGWAQVSIYQVN